MKSQKVKINIPNPEKDILPSKDSKLILFVGKDNNIFKIDETTPFKL